MASVTEGPPIGHFGAWLGTPVMGIELFGCRPHWTSPLREGDQAWEGSLPTGILPGLIRNYSFEYMVGDKYSFVSIPLSVVKVTYRSDSILERSLEVSDSSTLR